MGLLIKYQIVEGYRIDNGEVVLASPTIFTAEAKDDEYFEKPRPNSEETFRRKVVELRRKKDMVIPENTISDGSSRLQPRSITKRSDGAYLLWCGWPKGKSWSQGSQPIDIHILTIEENGISERK